MSEQFQIGDTVKVFKRHVGNMDYGSAYLGATFTVTHIEGDMLIGRMADGSIMPSKTIARCQLVKRAKPRYRVPAICVPTDRGAYL